MRLIMVMNEAQVQFLGSGDAFGSGGRYQTCIYVQAGGVHFLLDCGASSLIALKRFGVNPASISHILLTHLHGDHFGGIPFLVRETQIAAERAASLVIAGPRGLESRIHAAQEVFFPGSTRGQSFELRMIELEADVTNRVGPLSVTPYRAIHTPGTNPHILRVECGGKVIVYSGDTEWTEDLVKATDGADLFICETYFFEREVKNHLNYRTLMMRRAQLNCRRLIITHMSDDMLCRLPELEVEYAEDGKLVRL
jgi:ribonuclease BN (tRNA processing enzyme)